MLVSVIVPTYKPGDYLLECLDSLITQSLEHSLYEIVLVLNGCVDPYKKDIEDYFLRVQPTCGVTFINTVKPGVSKARNLGLEVAKGEYITFVDDDDIVSSNYLEGLLKVSGENCIGCANSCSFAGSIEELESNFITFSYENCSHKSFSFYNYRKFLSPPWCKLIHRDIIGTIRFPEDLRKSEDSVFCMLLTPRIKSMALASEGVCYYQRKREGSAMRKRHSVRQALYDFCCIEKKYLSIWLSNPLKYNLMFVVSRMVACLKNLIFYLGLTKE